MAALPSLAAGTKGPFLSTNSYPWGTFFQRENRDASQLDVVLGEVAQAGLNGYEPGVESAEALDQYAPLLEKHGLQMRSVYVNSVLHDEKVADQSIQSALKIAAHAKDKLKTRIIVTNPSPISWGAADNKTDSQLRFQAGKLNELGQKLSELGLKLAYHTHDPELRMAAREFHHMMQATDPRHVSLCLDSHWVYRGAGNSEVALFDIARMYGPRVAVWHLRQSKNGIWTEAFGPGDIDYPALAAQIKAAGAKPLLVLEQCIEKESPSTMTGLQAHKKDVEYAQSIFQGWA